MDKTAYILIGFPGSGKSTWAQKSNDGVIVSRDSIRRMIYGRYDFRSEDESLVSAMSRACAQTVARYWNTHTVIIDDTNLRAVHRTQWVSLFTNVDWDYRVIYVWFPADRRESWRRRCRGDLRGFTSKYWEDVINKMVFDPPVLEEGANEIITV